ncbi:PREDICTED: uncharacterized protein LOC105112316 [Populus euphratica]|uniref:Uncharacterized protein LOC105112316 n=1 Tax=Populus euphratica TaxID=75702 RepID=A0AAJ6T7Y6_POPEU|nr:PREDICTED: uncharacterized protein LOC105112316 [Populus euphratica]XP_011006291.1 PREDICTED: uncharacterized protein LOC105112316 [Populus euphratica]
MESGSYVLGGKGHVSNEPTSSSDTFSRSNNVLMSCDLKNQCNFEYNFLASGSPTIENGARGELGYQQLIEKHVPDTSIRNALISEVSGRKNINPFVVVPNSFSLEDESTSGLSSTAMDSDCRVSAFIDLNLGRFGDPRDVQNCRRIPKSTSIVSPTKSSAPPRRHRAGMNSHTAFCQVYDCNKDLSSSKEYHKRHKVCEVHSRTAKVIVNGIEQRFCQQCSRFHLLAEFDDGKRSCRKRLAGHNERRRKPQVGLQSGRTGRLLHPYNGFSSSRFQGTALPTSFICQDILQSGLSHPDKYGENDWWKRVKIEDGTGFSPPSAIPITNAYLHSKPLFPSNNSEKMFPTFHEDGASTASRSIFNGSTDRYLDVMGGRTSSSHSFLQDTSLGNDEFAAFDAASTIQEFSGITASGCARSLLSSQSQNSSSHSSGVPIAHQLLVSCRNTCYSMDQIIGVSSQVSSSVVPNKFSSWVTSSVKGSHLGPIPIPENSHGVNFDITDGVYHGFNAKDHLGSEDDTTIDLLQLSSQLQRVEHQKQSMQEKQEMILSAAPASLNKASKFL